MGCTVGNFHFGGAQTVQAGAQRSIGSFGYLLVVLFSVIQLLQIHTL